MQPPPAAPPRPERPELLERDLPSRYGALSATAAEDAGADALSLSLEQHLSVLVGVGQVDELLDLGRGVEELLQEDL